MSLAPTVTMIVRSMGRQCLANALASIDQQDYRPIELLVVDATGGEHPPLPSTPRVAHAELVGTGRRLSRPAAANAGLERARGDWIGFLDDDDFLEPTHVSRLVGRMTQGDHPTLVFGQLWGLDGLHRVVDDRYNGFNPLVLHYYCRTPGMSCVMHRSLRDAGHRLDESFDTSEDWEFWLRLLAHARIATVHERTHFYRMEAGTSGTGWGRNRHAGHAQRDARDAVLARYARERERVWAEYFAALKPAIAVQGDGDLVAAAERYAEALAAHPDEPNALYLLGTAYQTMGRPHVARLLLREAIFLNGDAAPYHFTLGQVCEGLSLDEETRSAYAEAARWDSGLQNAVQAALARLGPAPEASPARETSVAEGAARNAPCPCGSGLRYKHCHGAPSRAPVPRPQTKDGCDELLSRATHAAQRGEITTAHALCREASLVDPRHAQALHATAVLGFDLGQVDAAMEQIERAARNAPDDPQIAQDRDRLRVYAYERHAARRSYAELAALPYLVPGTATLPSPPAGTPVHIIAASGEMRGEREATALALAQMLGQDASVHLWANDPAGRADISDRFSTLNAAAGALPRSGVLIFVGLDLPPALWLTRVIAARVVVVHDAESPALLLDFVRAAHEASGGPVQIVTPSEIFRRHCGIPAVSCPLPFKMPSFPRGVGRDAARPFTVGRRSRNDHRLFHPNDAALFRTMAESGMAVRILGGTVLMRHIEPAHPVAGLQLLPPDAAPGDAFERELDCVFYRASPLHPEPGGATIARALAAGVPVVCARDVGYAELVSHAVDGFLFDRDDDEAALVCVRKLHEDPELQRRMARAAEAKAQGLFGPELERRLRRAYLGEHGSDVRKAWPRIDMEHASA